MIPICCDRPMAIAYYTPTGRPSYVCPRCGNRNRKRRPPIAESAPEQSALPESQPESQPEAAAPDCQSVAPRRRGRPRKYAKDGDRQQAWKQRTGFERSEERRAYKREWERQKRQRNP
jgi:hypothetical protein